MGQSSPSLVPQASCFTSPVSSRVLGCVRDLPSNLFVLSGVFGVCTPLHGHACRQRSEAGEEAAGQGRASLLQGVPEHAGPRDPEWICTLARGALYLDPQGASSEEARGTEGRSLDPVASHAVVETDSTADLALSQGSWSLGASPTGGAFPDVEHAESALG